MLTASRTVEFREAVRSHTERFPPSKHAPVQFGNRIKSKESGEWTNVEDPWTKQAEQVATNLRSFANFLASIRRAYLDLSSTSASAHAKIRPEIDTSKGLVAWEGVRWFSDRERDEVDFGVKVALKRSVDRVRELEHTEKGRIAKELASLPSASTLSRLLSISPRISPDSTALTSHRAHITLYLNTLLSQVSQIQIKQQETRVKRQLDKSISLGAMSGGAVVGAALAEKARVGKVLDKGKGRVIEVGQVPEIYRPLPMRLSGEDDSGSSIESLLSPEQIQQFETEASAALQSTQTDLASLKLAETSLLEISALQSQLAIHLTEQVELTDKLWEEAIGVAGKVGEGNVELKKARERNRESRVWLLIFLLGASLSLLFLDYYA